MSNRVMADERFLDSATSSVDREPSVLLVARNRVGRQNAVRRLRVQVSTKGAATIDLRSGWAQAFDERELKMIELCTTYGKDPFGAPNHNFMLVIAKMQILLERYQEAYLEELSNLDG